MSKPCKMLHPNNESPTLLCLNSERCFIPMSEFWITLHNHIIILNDTTFPYPTPKRYNIPNENPERCYIPISKIWKTLHSYVWIVCLNPERWYVTMSKFWKMLHCRVRNLKKHSYIRKLVDAAFLWAKISMSVYRKTLHPFVWTLKDATALFSNLERCYILICKHRKMIDSNVRTKKDTTFKCPNLELCNIPHPKTDMPYIPKTELWKMLSIEILKVTTLPC